MLGGQEQFSKPVVWLQLQVEGRIEVVKLLKENNHTFLLPV